jgi:hypothetical protein
MSRDERIQAERDEQHEFRLLLTEIGAAWKRHGSASPEAASELVERFIEALSPREQEHPEAGVVHTTPQGALLQKLQADLVAHQETGKWPWEAGEQGSDFLL